MCGSVVKKGVRLLGHAVAPVDLVSIVTYPSAIVTFS
jgi:hypothetical protein